MMNHVKKFFDSCKIHPGGPSRLAMMFACLLLSLSWSIVAVAKDPCWILNHGNDIKAFSVGQGNIESSLGLVHIRPMGTDLTMFALLPKDQCFDAATHPFFAMRYKIKSSIPQGGLFFTNDTLTTISDVSYSPFKIIGDGNWHNVTIDLRTYPKKNWKGTITSFRLDPINPSNLSSEIEISRFGFFAAEQQASAFLDQANDKPDYSLETIITTTDVRCVIPGNIMKTGDLPQSFLPEESWTIEETTQKLQSGLLPEQLAVAVDDGTTRQIVPLSVVTRRGYAVYEARKKGKYFLTTDHKAGQITDLSGLTDRGDIVFAVARGFMTCTGNRFEPARNCTPDEVAKIIAAVTNAGCDPTELRQFLAGSPTRAQVAHQIAAMVLKCLELPIQSPFEPEYFTRDRIRFGASFSVRSNYYKETLLRDFAECGFDWILASGIVCSDRYRGQLLSTCNQFGIELFINDGAHVQPGATRLEYFDHPCLSGHIVTDEPGSDSFDKLAKVCNTYRKETGGKIPFVNLLPMYANAAQLKYGAGAAAIEYYDSDPAVFKNYCDAFCKKFDVPYICTDIYPLNWLKGKKVTYKDYAESINIIANSAREHHKDFWCYIQTFAWVPSKRTPTEEEFRWQCYSMLSFGCKGLLCWTYAGYKEEAPSLIDTQGNKTAAWYAIRPVVAEIKRLSDVYVQYRNLGAFAHKYSDRVPYLRISTPYTAFKTIEKIDCPQPLLVGCFEKKSAPGNAFTLVNMAEFQDGIGTTAILKLSGKKVTAYYRGEPEVIMPDPQGLFHFHLACGEGVFVTVE
ncbi:MAG: hypothetical protein PHQ75_11295 [Thermoguttaceae bacterium]|nr:hypothetical protein [Thermoguttaceae bacterium]